MKAEDRKRESVEQRFEANETLIPSDKAFEELQRRPLLATHFG